ncbi:hypothetical protein [Calycomorphotria hydatis]|uniref:Uncharacterized protein n=1 Tax=Calycomorphotria hydatis TaxID=2528027 RepID=A0A517T7J9_9PLAN|nr:hypothetical protein [Calycomorphotria hydatis]QDT64351.1 hypothetical protein V22_15850 [Calycomorphotria hydatis]
MDLNRTLLIAATLLLPLSVGCTQDTGIVRAQSPIEQTSFSKGCGSIACGDACGMGACASGQCGNGFYGRYKVGCPSCKGHGCQHCKGLGGFGGNNPFDTCSTWYPHHKTKYGYHDPGCQVYPQGTMPGGMSPIAGAAPPGMGPGTPPAIVQYPYATCKGPDDFFLDKDGIY